MREITKFSGLQYSTFVRPLVYKWISIDGEVLYVGKSFKGLCRPLDPSHHAIDSERPVRADDIFEIMYCHSEKEASILEAKLIKTLKPTYNKAGLNGDIPKAYSPQEAFDQLEISRALHKSSVIPCGNCLRYFQQKRWWQRFCSPKCSNDYHNLF